MVEAPPKQSSQAQNVRIKYLAYIRIARGLCMPDNLETKSTKKEEKSKETALVKAVSNENPNTYQPYILAQHRKISISSADMGTYDSTLPVPMPDTADATVTVSDLQYIFQTNPVVHKAFHIRANRLIGQGFELLPNDDEGIDPIKAQEVCDVCAEFHEKINYKYFYKNSIINAYTAGNEWTEIVYNQITGFVVNLVHGDYKTIDFRRNFINNKVLIDANGEPVGYWQNIEDLSQLYYSLSTYYGEVGAYENLQASKERLRESQTFEVKDPNTGDVIAIMTTKPNYMFLKQDEIAHLSFNNINDNFFGSSAILPAYNSIMHLEQVMYAVAEAINEMGFPKPKVKVGDDKHPPDQNLNDLAEDMITDPVRKEGFVMPFYMDMDYLEPGGTGTSNINDYPEWFIAEGAMGLRVPRELLTGEGNANRASSTQSSTDFDVDCEAERIPLERYILQILNFYLTSRGYQTDETGRCIFLPKIKWPSIVTEDQALREKMAIEKWNNKALTFNEYRTELGLNEVEDARGDMYIDEIESSSTTQSSGYDGLLTTNGEGSVAVQSPKNATNEITAQHALDSKKVLNPKLNKQLGTENVDYKKVAQKEVGTKIKTVDKAGAKRIRDTIVNGEAKKQTSKSILKKVQKEGNYTEAHARMILVTEQKNLAEHGSLEDAKKKGFTHKKWISKLDEDTSPICKALNGKVVKIDDDFKIAYRTEKGKLKIWKGKAPAAHPNCRSFLSFQNKG